MLQLTLHTVFQMLLSNSFLKQSLCRVKVKNKASQDNASGGEFQGASGGFFSRAD